MDNFFELFFCGIICSVKIERLVWLNPCFHEVFGSRVFFQSQSFPPLGVAPPTSVGGFFSMSIIQSIPVWLLVVIAMAVVAFVLAWIGHRVWMNTDARAQRDWENTMEQFNNDWNDWVEDQPDSDKKILQDAKSKAESQHPSR